MFSNLRLRLVFITSHLLQIFHTCMCITSNATRYRPLWDVTIAGPPPCPVWCLTAAPIAISQAPPNRVSPCHGFFHTADGRFLIGKPKFLFACHSNHRSILLSFWDIRAWQTDRRMDEQRGPLLYFGGLANKHYITEWVSECVEALWHLQIGDMNIANQLHATQTQWHPS